MRPMRMTRRALAAAIYLLMALSLAAQTAGSLPPAPPQRPLDAAKEILGLTDQQVQQLTDLRKTHRDKVQALMTQIRDLQRQRAAATDAATIGSLELKLRDLQKQLQDANTSYHTSALALLTQTQKDKVAQIEAALKLAPQAGALGALGLLEGPGGGPGFGGGRRFMMGPPPGGFPQGPGGPRPMRGGQPGNLGTGTKL